ncbi:MAG: cell division protein FtsW [Solirubrobacterales bacterium]|jgi:cell division protein FtsW|nr:cell division protein FtsW [Solirubrobacterales bacterium]
MASSPRRAQPLEYNILLTAVLCLLAAGAVMVYSASSSRILLEGEGNGSTFLIKYVSYGAIGLVVMHVLARRGIELVMRWTSVLLAGAFLLLVLVKTPLGVEINGAQRWLGFGPLQFQPSEVMKLAMVLYAVKLLATRPTLVMEPRLMAPLGIVAAAACVLIASQPDLGTALVISFTLIALLVVAGIPMKTLGIGLAGFSVVVLLFALAEPYRVARLTSFLNPWADAGGAGFQSVQGQIALGSGGLFGRGLGESVQKAFFLPEAHTDFILAIIGEELGVAGIGGLLFLYGLIAYAGLRVAKAATSTYAKLLAAGLTAMVLCQASLNVFTVLGLAPLTGVPLPFISYGSTNLVVLLGAMGLLMNVASGGAAHLRLVATPSVAHASRSDRSRRDSRARRAGAGGGRRAAG